MSPLSSSRKAVLWVAAVFLLGLALGGVGGYALTQRGFAAPRRTSAEKRAHMVERLTSELHLTGAQQKRLDEILADLQAKYKAIHEQSVPQMNAARQQARDQVRSILTPEQKPQFEDFIRRLDEERKNKEER